MCADGAYKVYKSECRTRCPFNYIKDDVNHLCSFDFSEFNYPFPPQDPMGCMDGFFWNHVKQNCTPCNDACLTCERNENKCTSCQNGKYLSDKGKCDLCETFWKNAMIKGSSGACLEARGDGMNFGMHQCDDKNSVDGDGCSKEGLVEKDYKCTGGFPYSKDNCTYIPTELIEVKANFHNDLILKFSRPIMFTNGTIGLEDLKVLYKNATGFNKEVKYRVLTN